MIRTAGAVSAPAPWSSAIVRAKDRTFRSILGWPANSVRSAASRPTSSNSRLGSKASNAEWKVRFLWPFSTTYLVLELDPDYRWAVVGTPSRGLLWILARDRQLPAATYAAILERISAQGYDPAKLAKVPQPGE